MRTSTAPVIRLKNYTPSAYTISTVELDVHLSPERTKVFSRLRVHRSAGTSKTEPLVLVGDELKLEEIVVNGMLSTPRAVAAEPSSLTISDVPQADEFEIEIVTSLAPVHNKKLMGLYQSSGVFCTQCEAEGFRRITYFLDRPDVLAIYTVRIEATRSSCRHLLSNGNLVESGDLENGRHFAIWHDPHPKPSYLFALVGGNLDFLADKFITASGRKVDLKIYVELGKAPKAAYAMDALKRSMKWDEEAYGCEYDLDIFNIVAVSDFNMGAMENKGLNVFNDKYILADPNLATDADYEHIEAIVAHEYFHNWTGNRITCRDWFQLCLKEGLTVYRDQEFSSDQRSRDVQRIQQVKNLRAAQFTEDAGPLAHPVRPGAYKEINNFYTATVYQKGAELVRMLATMVGPENYRNATDLYFERYDGTAAVVEDFLGCFEEASGQDLTQFSRWYEQAGTPQIEVKDHWDRSAGRYTLTFNQSIAPTPGQKTKKLVPLPIRFGLLDQDGKELAPESSDVTGDVILLDKREKSVVFEGLARKPIASLLRGFSAPVKLNFKQNAKTLMFLAQHDGDGFNRWEAINKLAMGELVRQAKARAANKSTKTDNDFLNTLKRIALNNALDPALRALTLTLPTPQAIANEIGKNVDPDAVQKAYDELFVAVGKRLGVKAITLIDALQKSERKANDLEKSGIRKLKNTLLNLACAARTKGALEKAQTQFSRTKNMSDRISAFNCLLYRQSNEKIAHNALAKFYKDFKHEPLVINLWFALQATKPGQAGIDDMAKLVTHKDFSLENPNRARGLLGTFASQNLSGFHAANGEGYKFFADQILKLDAINPQIAARLLTLINNWRMFTRLQRRHAKGQLERIAAHKPLSTDVQEIVDRSLA